MTRHLSTLSILHYVYGGLCILGAVILGVTFSVIGGVMQSDLVQRNGGDPDAALMGGFMQGIGGTVAVVLGIWGILVCLSGSWIAKRRNRTASIVIAALCCLSFPIGTALGVFTIVVLLNDEVQNTYNTLKPI